MAMVYALGSLLAVLVAITPALPETLVSIYNRAATLNAALFFTTPDRTTYVSTGDIDAMWLRDSSVQTRSVMHNRALARGVINRQERLIVIDPYANAFDRRYLPIERKFEIDSLCYPIRLADDYARVMHDPSVYNRDFFGEMRAVLHVLETEQHHASRSHYHHNEHPIDPNIGLIWSAYRPSDEPQAYNYNIPENMFASVTLRTMARLLRQFYNDPHEADRADGIADRIDEAIARRAIFTTMVGRIYAYEIDGLGHAKFMDDANTPSLLSIPLYEYPVDARVYADTRRFILSPANPYYYQGRYASGIGSSHTPGNYVWPLSLVVQYRTATSNQERRQVAAALAKSSAGDGALHESFDVNDPRKFTRPSFGWVNALFEQTFAKQRM